MDHKQHVNKAEAATADLVCVYIASVEPQDCCALKYVSTAITVQYTINAAERFT